MCSVEILVKATSNASGTQLQDLLSRIESGVAAARRRLDRESGAAGDREVSAVRVDPGPEASSFRFCERGK